MSLGSFIENLNPFLLPLLTAITVAVLHYIFRIKNTPGRLRRLCHAVPFSPRRTHQVLLFVILIAFIGVVLFEYYFQYKKCAVSLRYYEENVRLFRQVTEILSSVGIIWWVDMATLLSALRNQPVTVWDHDTDISLIHPDSLHIWRQLVHQQLGGSEYVSATLTVSDIIATMNQHGIQAFYIPERELIQARWSDNPFGPHTDFWLWHVIAADSSTSSAFLTTVERSIVHSRRTYHEIFPLMRAVIFNVNVSIPHDSHGVSAREYNHYGGNYMQTQWFRKDCLHNWWQSRVSY